MVAIGRKRKHNRMSKAHLNYGQDTSSKEMLIHNLEVLMGKYGEYPGICLDLQAAQEDLYERRQMEREEVRGESAS